MKVSIYPANNGDSSLIETEASIILIDGGYVDTYRRFLKPKFIELNNENKKISSIVVTHIDNDHISTLKKFRRRFNIYR